MVQPISNIFSGAIMDLDWTGYYIPSEKDSSVPSIDELNFYNTDMREPFTHIVEAIRKHSNVREPLKKWQINQIVKNNNFDNFYDFVRLIEKAHGIEDEEWKSN
jgi:hypothetical protein